MTKERNEGVREEVLKTLRTEGNGGEWRKEESTERKGGRREEVGRVRIKRRKDVAGQ